MQLSIANDAEVLGGGHGKTGLDEWAELDATALKWQWYSH